ncbi:hypothetical protein E8M01_28040 [Phreatobacter stygius]|uniref:Lipoprotein n=1 Tax=Phreatobacter stygius TaxID=1940610 RepID=A0A4D7B2E1_9HYPH|nr:hypothetical protein E8M01_28040 [Phreatobacter stygius]
MRRLGVIAATAIGVSACAYQAQAPVTPASNVVVSFGTKIPGKWLVFSEGERLDSLVRPSDINCSAHNFPLSFRGSFPGSVRGTLANLFESIETVDRPVSGEELRRRGARGMVTIRGEDVRGTLRVAPGFWSANIITEVRITASIVVDGTSGRIFGQTVDGDGRGDTDAGAFCAGGAVSLSRSSEEALRVTMRRLGEAIGNSERVRAAR